MTDVYFNLILKFSLIMMFAAMSEIAMKKRRYGLTIFMFSLYAGIIRRTLIQLTVIPVGGFIQLSQAQLKAFQLWLQSPNVVNLTDFVMLVGVVVLFHWLTDFEECKKKEVTTK